MMFEKFRRRLMGVLASSARINALENRLFNIQEDTIALRLELDALRSRAEVSPQLIREFQRWKVENPIPECPLVSVCVATYNRAQLLSERCIPSILGQTYSNLELIVVGDGCVDDTALRLRKLHDRRLTFTNLTSRGEYPQDHLRRWMVAGTPAFNKAMALARGDFITHLDDDDEYLPQRLEKLVEFAKTNNCDFVWHPFLVQDLNGDWGINDARDFARGGVTSSSVFYRHWFKNIEWDPNAYRLYEPGDWNRFRRIKFIDPLAMRYPEPLIRHYREHSQGS